MEQLENKCLRTIEEDRSLKSKGLNPEKKYNKDPQNIVDYFISSHIQVICKELYDSNAQVNNNEVEKKICFSMFLIKKIIKDYSFYFNKIELETIYMAMKKFKK